MPAALVVWSDHGHVVRAIEADADDVKVLGKVVIDVLEGLAVELVVDLCGEDAYIYWGGEGE